MEKKSRAGRPRSTDVPPLGDVAQRFGEAVRRLREDRGWVQKELATAVARELGKGEHGFHVTTLAKVERGTRPTPLDEAAAIARVLGQPLERLLEPASELREALLVATAEHEAYRREVTDLCAQAAAIEARLKIVTKHEESARRRVEQLSQRVSKVERGE